MHNHRSKKLVLNPVQPEHAGMYYCKVSNDGGIEWSTKAILSFGGFACAVNYR